MKKVGVGDAVRFRQLRFERAARRGTYLTSMRTTSVRRQVCCIEGGVVDESDEMPHSRRVCKLLNVASGFKNYISASAPSSTSPHRTHLTNAPHSHAPPRPPPHVHSLPPSRPTRTIPTRLHVLRKRVQELEVDEGGAEGLSPGGGVRGEVEGEREEGSAGTDDAAEGVHRVEEEPACDGVSWHAKRGNGRRTEPLGARLGHSPYVCRDTLDAPIDIVPM